MAAKTRVCAVSYLNTAPLVWGLKHGPQKDIFKLSFALPSECADNLQTGEADIGLVPIIEFARQPDLVAVPGCGISCKGSVRSILIVSKRPFEDINSIAVDHGSRTSVLLAQILVANKQGKCPGIVACAPEIGSMLDTADAALLIGDPALQIDPEMDSWQGHPVHVFDLGSEWEEMTGLPMVFAVWGVRKEAMRHGLQETLLESAAYGQSCINQIIRIESQHLGLEISLVKQYLTQNIHYSLSRQEHVAMNLYFKLAADLQLIERMGEVPFITESVLTA